MLSVAKRRKKRTIRLRVDWQYVNIVVEPSYHSPYAILRELPHALCFCNQRTKPLADIRVAESPLAILRGNCSRESDEHHGHRGRRRPCAYPGVHFVDSLDRQGDAVTQGELFEIGARDISFPARLRLAGWLRGVQRKHFRSRRHNKSHPEPTRTSSKG
jgi:hypothetical protein